MMKQVRIYFQIRIVFVERDEIDRFLYLSSKSVSPRFSNMALKVNRRPSRTSDSISKLAGD